MFDDAFLDEIKREMESLGGGFREVYMESSKGYVVSRENGVDKDYSLSDCGIGVRVARGGNWSFKWKKTSSREEMARFVGNFDKERSGPSLPGGSSPEDEDISEPQRARGKKVLDNVFDSTGMSSVSEVRALARSSRDEVAIISSAGARMAEKRDRRIFYIQTAVKGASRGADAVMVPGKAENRTLGSRFRSSAEEAVRLAKLKQSRKKSIQGELPVVFSGKAGGFLLHETVGHFFEADGHKKERAEGILGSKIGGKNVTLYESGPRAGFASFDDEGTAPREEVLVEGGKVVSLLTNRRSASELSLPLTGNARRAGYRHEPLVRMWDLRLAPGEAGEEELLSGIGFGLSVKRLEDGKVDLRTGEFSFPVVEGYLIREGRSAEFISGVEISGRTPRLLKDIELIGKECDTQWGLCMKKRQVLWISETVPSFRIGSMSVTSAE